MGIEASKFTIRIEGDPVEDQLIHDLLVYAKKIGLKPTSAARLLLRRSLEKEGYYAG